VLDPLKQQVMNSCEEKVRTPLRGWRNEQERQQVVGGSDFWGEVCVERRGAAGFVCEVDEPLADLPKLIL
jgi:hypothetical protein